MSVAPAKVELPIVIDEPPATISFRVLQGVVIAIAAAIVSSSRYDATDGPMLIVIGLAVVFVLGLDGLRRNKARRAGRTEIDRDGVRHVGRSARWSEPLSAYDGLVWREEYVRRNQGGYDTIYYLDVRHRTDRRRTVAIARRQESDGVRAEWEAAAAALGLPAIRKMPDGAEIGRKAEDVDRSLGDTVRADRGAVSVPLAAPADVQWPPETPEVARVQLSPLLRKLALIGAVGFAAIWTFANVQDGSPALLVLGLLAELAALIVLAGFVSELRIEDDRLVVRRSVGPICYWRYAMVLDEIEQAWAAPAPHLPEAMRAVTIASDRMEIKLSPISPEAADWVVAFVEAAAVRD